MDRESTQRLRLDKRLMRRRGWIAKAELEKALADLPDVSDKAVVIEGDEAPKAPDPSS